MGGFWQLVFACYLLVQSLSAENNATSAVEDNATSAVNPDEELEKDVGRRVASLREMGQDEIRDFTNFALQYYNMEEDSVFTTLEDATVTVKKAIGSMLYLRMTLEKTNCTKKDLSLHSPFRFMRRFDPDFRRFGSAGPEAEDPPKYCGPLAGNAKEQLDCKFDFFKNERSYGESVVSHDCKPVRVIDRSIFSDEEHN